MLLIGKYIIKWNHQKISVFCFLLSIHEILKNEFIRHIQNRIEFVKTRFEYFKISPYFIWAKVELPFFFSYKVKRKVWKNQVLILKSFKQFSIPTCQSITRRRTFPINSNI